MMKLLLIGCGGFLGAVTRFGAGHAIRSLAPATFPFATLAVNFAGSIGIGLVFEYFREHPWLPQMTLFAAVGFLGSFTTFSTFSFETVELYKRGESTLAVANALGNVMLCLGGVLAGEGIARLLRG